MRERETERKKEISGLRESESGGGIAFVCVKEAGLMHATYVCDHITYRKATMSSRMRRDVLFVCVKEASLMHAHMRVIKTHMGK